MKKTFLWGGGGGAHFSPLIYVGERKGPIWGGGFLEKKTPGFFLKK